MSIVRQIDLKHHIDERGEIIKTTNGQAIPHDEPTILFRARDYLAVPLLIRYREMCTADGCNNFQLDQVNDLIRKFSDFAKDHPEVMKQPGITRGL
jgi:predicted methyltransferase